MNKEDTTTKTSVENVWKKPSSKQLGMYNKGVLFSDMYPPKVPDDRLEKKPVPPGIMESDCPLGIMLRKEAQVKENLARLNELIPHMGHPEVMFSAAQVSSEDACMDFMSHVMISDEECAEIARRTVLQSACPQWHREREMRISASIKAHRIKIRKANFDTLAQDLATPRQFSSAACAYGLENEPAARKEYEALQKCTVTEVGLVVCIPQPWLCCSPDGLLVKEGKICLLEVKCPSRCEKRPIVDENVNVDYLEVHGKELELHKNHVYYTQVQVSMYVVGAGVCDFYVYSPRGSVLVQVKRDDSFLREVIPKLEWFFFRHYFPAVIKRQKSL